MVNRSPAHQADGGQHTMTEAQTHAGRSMYVRLLVMLGLSLLWMYAAMFAMVATFSDVYMNLNFVYMAALMAAPMGLFELALMSRMYPDLRWNLVIGLVSGFVLIGSFLGIRTQLGVGNGEFLRSMIPHHSGAILMCEQASISDPEVVELCRGIIENQESEIAEMKRMLSGLD